MDVVLGLSMTAITVRVVLVEGERADGVTIENEAFDTVTPEGVPSPALPSKSATQSSQLSKMPFQLVTTWLSAVWPGRTRLSTLHCVTA